MTLREAGVGGGVPVYVNGSDKVDRTLFALSPSPLDGERSLHRKIFPICIYSLVI